MFEHDFLLGTYEDVPLSPSFWRHPIIQELRGKKQLGPLEGNKSASTHTRYEHSVMATRVARAAFHVLARHGMEPCAGNDLAAATATHDMGHPGFSHPPEKLYKAIIGLDHKEWGLRLLHSDIRDADGKTLEDTLRESKVGLARLEAMLAGKDPAMKVCSDSTLGADKLAYLLLDAKRVNFNQLPPDPRSVLRFLAYIDGVLGIEVARPYGEFESPFSNVEAVQYFQMRMYTDVYFSARTASLDRAVQKAIDFAIRAGIFTEQGMSERDAVMKIWPLADEALMDRIRNGNGNPTYDRALAKEACTALDSYRLGNPYVPVVAFKYRPFTIDRFDRERIAEMDKKTCLKFVRSYEDPREVTNLERDLDRKSVV